MKFVVATEDRGFQFDVVVEADTIEEAVKLVREQHCQPRQVEVTPRPTWAEPLQSDDPEECYELTWEVGSECADCGVQLFHRHGTEAPSQAKGWPWSYASGDEGCYTDVCYPCAQKRKAGGNYCAFYGNYYRDDHHHGCDSCPVGDCLPAKKRHYEKLDKLLRKVVSYTNVEPAEVIEFLDNNEFGLAYDALIACEKASLASAEDRDSLLKEAGDLLTKGYMGDD